MELLLGSHVREHGSRVGKLAGFELDPSTRRISHIIFSVDGTLEHDPLMRPILAVSHVHDGGEIELRADIEDAHHDAPDVVLLGAATRLKQDDHLVGHLVGVDVNPADQRLMTILGKTHWWSKQLVVDAKAVDCSTPGELRAGRPARPS